MPGGQGGGIMRCRQSGIAVVVLCLLVVAWACAQEQKAATEEPAQKAASTAEPAGETESEPAMTQTETEETIEGDMVRMTTSMGVIDIELFPDQAPITVENFLRYVSDGFYDGTIFHRVIPNFVIQGGGFTPDFTQKGTRPPIKNEAANGLKNDRGTLSMARTNVVDSATSQFFINLKDNANLDHVPGSPSSFGYAVFAKVVAGMDVVDAIAKVATGAKPPHQDVPLTPVVIEKAEVLPPEE
jgi:cyclophilin family peptidyl-prolyl cis-trans isomerase